MKTNRYKKLELIAEYIYHLEKMREINSYLYNHTELFEKKYEKDYNFNQFNYFAGKITYFTKERNKINDIFDDELEKQDLQIILLKR